MILKRIQLSVMVGVIAIAVALVALTVVLFSRPEASFFKQHYTFFCHIILTIGLVNCILSWASLIVSVPIVVLIITIFNPILMVLNSQQKLFMPFVGWYLIVWGALFYFHHVKKNKSLMVQLQVEKVAEERNKLNTAITDASSALESYFSRYSNYFNLREVANKFSTTLSLRKISYLVVDQTLSILKKGDVCLLFLCDIDENTLSLTASKSNNKGERVRTKIGTLFDRWVIKTRQNLIITDLNKEFRFDASQVPDREHVMSLIAAPLVHGSRIIGNLRINASQPDTFSTDDLRILNIMAVLAASAIGNALLYRETEELAIRDSLTNLYVQRYFKERLKEEHKRALITNGPLSLLMCDLDHFKDYNDKHGHAAGDVVLRSFAQVLIGFLGDSALVARYGGEEFAVLLPKIDRNNAREIAEELRAHTERHVIDLRGTETRITVSIGVASIPDDTLDAEELISKADRRLYDAKKKGRNRIC